MLEPEGLSSFALSCWRVYRHMVRADIARDESGDQMMLTFWICILSCWLLSFRDLAML